MPKERVPVPGSEVPDTSKPPSPPSAQEYVAYRPASGATLSVNEGARATGRESADGMVARLVDMYYHRPTSTQRGNPSPATWI